nr:retrotransposon protein, putative, Ty1-copia subclass [Tanacetum cinerariifolium]
GVRAQVEAIGSFDLVLPNGLIICLDNYHSVPTITRGVVSVHHLVENEFIQCFTVYDISVSKNDILYFNVIPRDGIYEIDMHNLVPNVNSIYNVSNKRAKHNLVSTYLWQCRLAHISKKRTKKLQYEGILRSTDDESFDQCVSCLSGKMTRKPILYRIERETDLLGIIHTDVCGPLRHVSRQGYPKKTMGYYFYFPPKKIVVARYAEFFEKNLITQEVEGFKPPQEEVIPICRPERTHQAPNHLCLNVEAEEHSLRDLNEPTRYKAAMLDPESNKWLDAINAKMQSMIDNKIKASHQALIPLDVP